MDPSTDPLTIAVQAFLDQLVTFVLDFLRQILAAFLF
jgi:hypothetical protein